ncbi:MFS transporter [Thermodesulfobacteriota bacterium]
MNRFLKDKIFYGWIIAAAGFLIAFVGLGSRLSFGVFVKSIEEVFGLSRGATSGIFSVYMLLCSVFAVLGGLVLDKYGPKKLALFLGAFTGLSMMLTSRADAAWQIFVTYSLLLSLGTGPVFTLVNSTAARWFDKNRGLVLGVTSSAGGLGAIVMAPFATYMITDFGWRTAFLVIGALSWLVIGGMGLLLIKDPGEIGLLPDGKSVGNASTNPSGGGTRIPNDDIPAFQALKKSRFWFLALVWLFLSLCIHLIFIHVAPCAVDRGVNPMNAAFILSLIGISTLVGRVAVGKISDIIGRRAPVVVCGILQAGSLLFLIWADHLWMFYTFAVGFGAFSGGVGAVTTVLIGDVFGMGSIGAIMGMLGVGWAIGAALGPALAGYIFDLSGSYAAAFLAAAVASLLATCFISLVAGKK